MLTDWFVHLDFMFFDYTKVKKVFLCKPCVFSYQDGLNNEYLQTGQVLASVDEDSAKLLVLSNHKWGTLVWPLAIVPGGRLMNFMLVGDAGCCWEFVYCVDSWRATPTEAKWSDEFGVFLQSIGPSESLLKNSLRFSNSLTFQHLVKMATELKLHAPKRLSRKELLEELAKVLSPDDPLFVQLVLEQDTKSKKGAVSSGNLATCLFEQ